MQDDEALSKKYITWEANQVAPCNRILAERIDADFSRLRPGRRNTLPQNEMGNYQSNFLASLKTLEAAFDFNQLENDLSWGQPFSQLVAAYASQNLAKNLVYSFPDRFTPTDVKALTRSLPEIFSRREINYPLFER